MFSSQHMPVSSTFHGGDDWSTKGIAFEDYVFMRTQQRKQSGERRLPTPEWAVNYTMQRELLTVFFERRAHQCGARNYAIVARAKGISLQQRLADAQALLVSRIPNLEARLDKQCKEYVAAKRAGASAAVLRKREIQIEVLDTRLRVESKDGGLGVVARIIQLYYGCCLDSVGVGMELGIKPPMVRITLWQLHRLWALLQGVDIGSNKRNGSWRSWHPQGVVSKRGPDRRPRKPKRPTLSETRLRAAGFGDFDISTIRAAGVIVQ